MIGALLVIQAGIKIPSVHKRPAPETKETPAKKAVAASPRGDALAKEAPSEGTPSWASDHNYNAVKPEQSAAAAGPLLYKCTYFPGAGCLLWRALPGPPQSCESRRCPSAEPTRGRRPQSRKQVPVPRNPLGPRGPVRGTWGFPVGLSHPVVEGLLLLCLALAVGCISVLALPDPVSIHVAVSAGWTDTARCWQLLPVPPEGSGLGAVRAGFHILCC